MFTATVFNNTFNLSYRQQHRYNTSMQHQFSPSYIINYVYNIYATTSIQHHIYTNIYTPTSIY